jgi:hypothetical protein
VRSLALALLLCLLSPALGQEAPAPDPWALARIAAEPRAEIKRVRKDATVSAALKPRRVQSSEAVYRYLLTNLPLASRWLRALKLGDYDLSDLPEGKFQIDDKAGAKAIGERALSEPGRLVVIARGTLEVPLLPKIKGVGVILIRFPKARDVKGEPAALLCSAETAFRVEGRVLHGLGRALRRILRKVVRDKLDSLVKSATALAESINRDPTGTFKRLQAAKVAPKDLEAFRQRFLAL